MAETYPQRLRPLFETYSTSIGEGAAIYNGPEYRGNDLSIAGDPYYLTKSFAYGSVIYMGYQYDSLVMAYDSNIDQLVLAYPNTEGFFAIVPVKSRIDAFRIHGHTFVHIRDTEKFPGIAEAGYYDVLFDGEHRILARRQKVASDYREGDYLYRYETNDRYYIRINGEYRIIRGRRGLLSLFSDQKRELRRFIRQSRYDFKDDPDNLMRVLGPYLDELR
ncbi:MAG: hypothetical protein P8X57_13005 [Cyclobacteriaceae bacterium]